MNFFWNEKILFLAKVIAFLNRKIHTIALHAFKNLNCKLRTRNLNFNTKNSSPPKFFEIMAYNFVVMFLRPILRNLFFAEFLNFDFVSELSAILDT